MPGNQVLLDSCIWIDFFRKGNASHLDVVEQLLDERRVTMCGIVEMEILAGARPAQQKLIKDLFAVLSYYETSRGIFQAAGKNLFQLRSRGVTVPSSDAVIAALCLQYDLELMTTDRHFDHFENLKRFRF